MREQRPFAYRRYPLQQETVRLDGWTALLLARTAALAFCFLILGSNLILFLVRYTGLSGYSYFDSNAFWRAFGV